MRSSILNSPIGLVENVESEGVRIDGGFSPDFQIALPYQGGFVWHVGRDHVISDSRNILFVSAGEEYGVTTAHRVGYRELIITPALRLLKEMTDREEATLRVHPLFRNRSRHATQRLSVLRMRLLHCAGALNPGDDLAIEELMIRVLREALDQEPPHKIAASTSRLVDRIKEFLSATAGHPIRLRHIADAVGASPTYISHTFHQVEGLTLHEYLQRLRLTRALVELPHADDLTTLAIASGFSSHSHFSAVFSADAGLNPIRVSEDVPSEYDDHFACRPMEEVRPLTSAKRPDSESNAGRAMIAW
jgi:AraC family transcriptional regulator